MTGPTRAPLNASAKTPLGYPRFPFRRRRHAATARPTAPRDDQIMSVEGSGTTEPVRLSTKSG